MATVSSKILQRFFALLLAKLAKPVYEKVLETLEEQVKTNNIEQFVSFGWDPYELAEKRAAGYNFAEAIESIAPGIPVVLIDGAGHGAVCNNQAS